ncbi:MAG: extracellular solute-binding protein [Clostridiaceae bacterium]|nr:extracellular solute-binding protein [Clostridiaceae bacterium]
MNKVAKRMGCLITCSLLAVTLLTGCRTPSGTTASDSTKTSNGTTASSTTASEGQKYKDIKLVYWSNWEATEPQGVVITEAVKAFEEKTGATVDLQFKGRKGIKEGLIPALDANQQVDLFDGAGNKSNYGERIINLENLVKAADYEKDTNPVLMKLCRSYYSDGKLYEIPYQMKANAYLYNKTLFKQAGINEKPTNWKEFLTVCQKLKDAGIIPLTTDDAYATQAFGMHLARLLGSDEVKKVVKEGLWDKAEVLQTAKAFQELASNGYFSGQVGSNVWPTGQNTEFATGKAAMYCVGTYVVNETKNITDSSFQWGFFGYPEVDGGINGLEAMVIGSQSLAVTNKCENTEAAFALLVMLTRGEWDAKLAKESLALPADMNNTSWPDQLADAKPYMDNCTEIFATSGGLEGNPDITPALKENLMKLYAGTCTAEEFVANMTAASKK